MINNPYKIILNQITVNIELRPLTLLIGENGSGKSTFINEIVQNNEKVIRFPNLIYNQFLVKLTLAHYQEVFRRYKVIFPETENVGFSPSPHNIIVKEKNIENYIETPKLGYGKNAILNLLIMEQFCLNKNTKESTEIVIIENIELGIHPRKFETVVNILNTMAYLGVVKQVIITTYSPYFLDNFHDRLYEVLHFTKKDGIITIKNLGHMDELMVMKDPLGSLWYSGFFGKQGVKKNK